MPKGDVETFHEDGTWHNRIEGGDSLNGSYSTRKQAVAAGREEAMRRTGEHLVHNVDGTIGETQHLRSRRSGDSRLSSEHQDALRISGQGGRTSTRRDRATWDESGPAWRRVSRWVPWTRQRRTACPEEHSGQAGVIK